MITRTLNMYPTPEELAENLWGMGSEDQVRFFNRLAEIVDPTKFVFQLQYITDGDLTIGARARMCEIGEYSGARAYERP